MEKPKKPTLSPTGIGRAFDQMRGTLPPEVTGRGWALAPNHPLRVIIDEAYKAEKSGVPIEDEANKARVLLEVIEGLREKGRTEGFIKALGFDVEELKAGRIVFLPPKKSE